jgi:signal transduction histidine kinase
VDIELLHADGEAIVRVTDTGCGISEQERDAVQRRFYRSDKIRNTPGVGLGLNLVAAIVKLHGFRLAVFPGPGCRVEIICPGELMMVSATDKHSARESRDVMMHSPKAAMAAAAKSI